MVKVAVAQVGAIVGDTSASLCKLTQRVREAAELDVEFLVFPEAFIGGYPKGMDFGAVIGVRQPSGRDQFAAYFSSAITVPGPETEEICRAAGEAGITLVVGVIERDGGTLYCTAIYVSAEGILLGKHRKLMPTASERLIWGQGDGSTLKVFESTSGRFGAAICWENYMPQLRLAMYAQDLQLWCAPTVDDRDIWQATMRHIAYEGRVFVLSACQYLPASSLPAGYESRLQIRDDGALIGGGSVIISPLGTVLAGPLYGGEGFVVAEIDMAEQEKGKYDLDVVGHYSRPDVFQLSVDTSPHRSVTLGDTPAMDVSRAPTPQQAGEHGGAL